MLNAIDKTLDLFGYYYLKTVALLNDHQFMYIEAFFKTQYSIYIKDWQRS